MLRNISEHVIVKLQVKGGNLYADYSILVFVVKILNI